MSLEQAYGGASIAVDIQKMNALVQTIQTDLIETSLTELNTAKEGLKEELSTYWVGGAANAYKSFLDKTFEVLTENLNDVMEGIKNTIDEARAGVLNADAEAAEAIARMENEL